jgi:hypothetical protein
MKITLEVEFKDHDKVVLKNESGSTYTSKSEELMDFLNVPNKIYPNPVLSDEICSHPIHDRIKHQGYHCNKCGHRF